MAEILERFRNLMMAGTERVTANASPGDAAFNSMRMDMEANGLVRWASISPSAPFTSPSPFDCYPLSGPPAD